jgi:hypothetical protein
MTKYPTRKEIEAGLEEFEPNDESLHAIKKWKKRMYINSWHKANNKEKITALQTLLYCFGIMTKVTLFYCEIGNNYCYIPLTKTIRLDKDHPSIISALHELGHHIYGSNELKACVFSIWYFKHFFPKEYNKLTWKGHMLVKKPYEKTKTNGDTGKCKDNIRKRSG